MKYRIFHQAWPNDPECSHDCETLDEVKQYLAPSPDDEELAEYREKILGASDYLDINEILSEMECGNASYQVEEL